MMTMAMMAMMAMTATWQEGRHLQGKREVPAHKQPAPPKPRSLQGSPSSRRVNAKRSQ